MAIYATVLVVVRRRRIPRDFFIAHLPRYFAALILLGLLAAFNDLFQVGTRLGGVAIPISPFSSMLINGSIIAFIGRGLVSANLTAAADATAGSGADLPAGVSETTAPFGLTLRESEILPLLLEGASNEEIGEKLHISPHTVKNHITVIYRKTGTENRFDLLKTLKRIGAES